MTPDGVDVVFRELLGALDETGFDHAVMGGYAVVTWGVPRATYDADVLVACRPEEVTRLLDACDRRGFVVDDIYRKGRTDRIRDMPLVKVQLFRDGRPITVDVFLAATPFQEAALARRVSVPSPSLARRVPVLTAADLILLKLMADRPKDRADVHNILAVQGIPDEIHLRTWAARLGLTGRLEAALAEAGLT